MQWKMKVLEASILFVLESLAAPGRRGHVLAAWLVPTSYSRLTFQTLKGKVKTGCADNCYIY